MKMRIFHRGLILVGVPLLIEIILIASLSALLYQFAQERLLETKYRRCNAALINILELVSSAPLVLAMSIQTHSDRLFQEYEKEKEEIRQSLKSMHQISQEISDIPKKRFQQVEAATNSVLKVSDEMAAARSDLANMTSIESMQGFQSVLNASRNRTYVNMEELFPLAERMTTLAQRHLEDNRHLQFIILACGFVLNISMAFALSSFYRRNILSRIRTIAANTVSMSRRETLALEIGGDDEIALFDGALHSMQEQLLQAARNEEELFNNASDVICVLDAQNAFVRVNPASRKDWGFEPAELKGKPLDHLLVNEAVGSVLPAIEESKKINHPVTFEAPIKTGDGSSKVGLWSCYWSKQEEQLFCIVHDVTERRKTELAKKKFLALISSDLRIPLDRLSVNLERTALLSELNEKGQAKLSVARSAVSRLLSLVNDLLEVTRLESGQFELHPDYYDLNALFQQGAADVEAVCKQNNLQMEILPFQGKVFFDKDRLMQVLVNLLSNAIKFSSAGSTITLSAELNNNFVICKVKDQGRGVPETRKKAIFEKFQQVELADGKRKAGTGLGLPICKKIIEAHGGQIDVYNNEDKGSTFWFSLPLNEEVFRQLKSNNNLAFAPAVSGKETALKDPESAGAETRQKPVTATPGQDKFKVRISLSAKGIILVGIPVLIELTVVGFLSSTLFQVERARTYELHQREVALTAGKLAKTVLNSAGALTGRTTGIRWMTLNLNAYNWRALMSKLKDLVANDPYASAEYNRFVEYSDKLSQYKRTIDQHESRTSQGGLASVLSQKFKYLPAVIGVNRHLRAIIDYAQDNEFSGPEKEVALRRTQFMILAAGLLFNIAFSVGLSLFFSFGISRRILVMADNAARFAANETLNPPISGTDELFDLDKSFHQMAGILSVARQKERAVFDNCQDVLCIISPCGRFLELNSAVESAWGYSKKELLSRSLEEIIFPGDLSTSKAAILGRIDSKTGITHECRIRRNDGKILHVLWSASRQVSEEGNTFCVVHDISDKKELEQLRHDFLGMVTHDLRTPLASIIVSAALLEAGAFGEISQETEICLSAVQQDASALSELINDILDLEKWNAGKMQLSMEPVCIETVIDAIQTQLKSLPCTIELCGSELGHEFAADRERLAQSIANLAKFMSLNATPGCELLLKAKQESSLIEIDIVAKGAIICAESCKNFFEEVLETVNTEKLGDGTFHADLVLPLAARTIESHNGTITIERLNDSENRIRVILPD